jgi:hypothetical protein
MSSPVWCNVKAWDKVSLEKAEFIHSQGEKAFLDILDGYKSLKARCQTLFITQVTLITAILGYVISSILSQVIVWPILTSAIVALIFLIASGYLTWRQLHGQELPVVGQYPKNLLNEEYAQNCDLKNLYIAECFTIQIKIDELKKSKETVNKKLSLSLLLMALIPIAVTAITVTIYVSSELFSGM